MTTPSTQAHDDQSAMPSAGVVMISADQHLAYVDLQRAAEYQAKMHPEDTVDWLRNALAAVRKAGEVK